MRNAGFADVAEDMHRPFEQNYLSAAEFRGTALALNRIVREKQVSIHGSSAATNVAMTAPSRGAPRTFSDLISGSSGEC